MELGRKCIISNIADDSKSIAFLLDPRHKEYFNAEFPIFYKNIDGSTVFDQALKKRQMNSLTLMLKYMVNYQNSYVYTNLFENCLLDMIQKEVKMKDLFDSDILNHVLEFIEWPDNHHNTDRILVPYNDPFF